MTPTVPWRVLQLADSGFPVGGFAHSGGLEASARGGQVASPADLVEYARAQLWNAGRVTLPFVAAAHDALDDVARVDALDALLDAQTTSHVANRASRAQGRALLATCARVFDPPVIRAMAARAAARESPAHLAVAFGATLAALGVGRRDALALHLLATLRGTLSAAVRLGAIGPLEAQRVQSALGETLDEVLASCEGRSPEQASTTSPLLDLFGATHDRLYTKLFQS
jgi:urease accessory protein